jgi:predicted transcriptional regulator
MGVNTKKTRLISARLPHEVVVALDSLAAGSGQNRTDVLLRALEVGMPVVASQTRDAGAGPVPAVAP